MSAVHCPQRNYPSRANHIDEPKWYNCTNVILDRWCYFGWHNKYSRSSYQCCCRDKGITVFKSIVPIIRVSSKYDIKRQKRYLGIHILWTPMSLKGHIVRDLCLPRYIHKFQAFAYCNKTRKKATMSVCDVVVTLESKNKFMLSSKSLTSNLGSCWTELS